jgi:hypothetical protein
MNDYYVYAFLRENRYSPYYIGKGRGRRYIRKEGRCVHPPTDKERIVKIKENLTEEEAFDLEVILIKQWGDNLYNQTEGGDGVSGYKHSEESKQKMRNFQKGRLKSPEHKRKISEAMKGKTKSVDHIQKIADSKRGVKLAPCSQERKDKISKSLKGRKLSDEVRKKMSEAAKRRRKHPPKQS